MAQHDVSEGFIRQIGRNYFMILTIDGQRQQRKTGTNDPLEAQAMLDEWKAQAKIGFTQEPRLRYEEMRDHYLGDGKTVPGYILKEFDVYFKNLRVSAITVDKMRDFRTWREASAQEQERREETIAKEIAWRLQNAGKVSEKQKEEIKASAIKWVENGIKATTNRRLSVLRAMLNKLAKDGEIRRSDVPAIPMIEGVDNKRRGFLEREDLPKLLAKLPRHLHPIVQFIYETGMRSTAAKCLTWDMVDRHLTEIHVPGELLKNGEDLVLPLVDRKGSPLRCFSATVKNLKKMKRTNGVLFDSTDLRSQWRQACNTLGYGVFNKKTQAYRGLKLHDFRRSACRNMVRDRIPQVVAMAISGHKTDSIFKRYAITDKSTIQEALSQV